MAIKNLKLTIAPPALDALSPKVVFTTSATADDYLRIPRRYPFADITAPTGFFRHNIPQNGSGNAATAVSAELGGSDTTNTEGKLGYELPHAEKLVLLVKKGASGAESFTIEGSLQYRIPDLVISVPAGAANDIYEFSLANFGLYIEGIAGEKGLMIKNATTTLAMALIVRAA